MRIVDIRERAIKLDIKIRNAAFSFDEMTTSIVAVTLDPGTGEPVTGFAFNSTGRYACGAQMRDRFIPRLIRAPADALLDPASGVIDPARAVAAMTTGEKPGGDMERSVAIGTIEVALWDAIAKAADQPLWQVLAERFGGARARPRMFCYVGGGYYAQGKTTAMLQDEIRGNLDAGYRLMKIKIGGAPLAEDLQRIEAAIEVVGDGANLAVDANCGFNRDQALAYATALAPYGLRWYEEPLHPSDYQGHGEVIEAFGGPVATGENLYSTEDVRNLVRHAGMRAGTDVIQIDVPQSYGIATFARTMDMLHDHGWSEDAIVPHGGNQMSLHVACGFGLAMCEAYPNVFGDFSGYADDAVLDDGYLTVSDLPGIGFEGQTALYRLFAELN